MERVSRTYTVDYDLSNVDRTKLAAIFEKLPGFCGYDEGAIPAWFGRDEESAHLLASVEPSGLLVEGMLEQRAWQRWDAEFRKLASHALRIEVRDADE